MSAVNNHVQASLQQKYEKISLTNQFPPKTVTSRINSERDNSNLVISFSEDESSSGSDDNSETKQFKNKGSMGTIHGNRKPSTLTTGGTKMYCKAPRNINLNMSKQPSLSHTFVPTMIKNHGGYRRVDDVFSGGQGINSRNNIVNKRMDGQDHGWSLGSKKLELLDLRHQIALRENELKLRSAQLNKPSISGACRDSEALNSSQDSGRRLISKSADAAELGPREPPSKRPKVGPSYYTGRSLEQERPAARSLSPPKSLMLGSSKMNKLDHVQKASSIGATELSIARWNGQDGSVVRASREPHESKQEGNDFTICTLFFQHYLC